VSSTPRQPAGAPVGGQFAATARTEAAVDLEAPGPLSYPRSCDRPDSDTWQYPAGVARFDALTAYDDQAGTYTIGDDLHIKAPPGANTYWIGAARSPLAQMHRAGLTGHAAAYGTGWRDEEGWRLDLSTPSGQHLAVETRSDHSYQAILFSGQLSAVAESRDYTPISQDTVDAAALRVVTAGALIHGWRTQVEAAVGDQAWKSRVVFVPSFQAPDGPPAMTIRPQVGQVDTHVTFGPVGEVATIRESRGLDRDLGTPRELALANLGRRIGLPGGRRAGVPAQVEAMLTVTGATDTHPDVIWLKANQARAREAEHL